MTWTPSKREADTAEQILAQLECGLPQGTWRKAGEDVLIAVHELEPQSIAERALELGSCS